MKLIYNCLFIIISISLLAIDAFAATVSVDLGSGYRQDQLTWSIAGNIDGNDPNILSELEWDIESVVVTSDLWVFSGKAGHVSSSGNSRFFLHLQGDYGWIYNGDNRDSDYSGDNRTGEYSRSENAADGGHVYDLTGDLGWELSAELAPGSRFSAAPMVGYGYSVQQLTLTAGAQTLASSGTTALGPFPGLDSRYLTQWYGSFAGMTFRYDRRNANGADIWAFWVDGRHHWVEYRSEGEWNLRTDLAQNPSFKDRAKGTGWDISCGWKYDFSARSSVSAEVQYSHWKADQSGIATFYLTDGTAFATRFNEVEWTKKQASLSYVYLF